jgi:hypothetical protein
MMVTNCAGERSFSRLKLRKKKKLNKKLKENQLRSRV